MQSLSLAFVHCHDTQRVHTQLLRQGIFDCWGLLFLIWIISMLIQQYLALFHNHWKKIFVLMIAFTGCFHCLWHPLVPCPMTWTNINFSNFHLRDTSPSRLFDRNDLGNFKDWHIRWHGQWWLLLFFLLQDNALSTWYNIIMHYAKTLCSRIAV